MEIRRRYLLASLALHAVAIGAVAVVEPLRRHNEPTVVPCPIRFEIVEAAGPKSPEPPERLDCLEKLEHLEKLDKLEHLESLENLDDSPALEAPEERAYVLAAPVALNRIAPAYPRSARRKGHEGSVTVEFSLEGNGGVSAAEVAASSGHSELDKAALAAVRAARFAPAEDGGFGGRFSLTLDFRLDCCQYTPSNRNP